jgi:hypothetical protein
VNTLESEHSRSETDSVAQRASAVVLGGVVTALAFANGGYFPTSWGWATLALAWLAALALLASPSWSRMEWVMGSALVLFAIWSAMSAMWSVPTDVTPSVERLLVVVVGYLACISLLRTNRVEAFVTSLVVGVSVVCSYALVTRLFPGGGTAGSDRIAAYRLTRPIGYWNALGIFAAIGLILALALTESSKRLNRVVGAVAVPILALTMYFTFSRGAALALVVGIAVAALMHPSPQQLVISGLLPSVLAVGLVIVASRSVALTTAGSPVSRIAHDGHRLALFALCVCVVTGVAGYFLRPIDVPPRSDRRVRVMVLTIIVVLAVVGLVAGGGPGGIKDKFAAPPPATHGELNKRLFSFSGSYRAPLWHVAWREFKSHPALGGGSGSYETFYLQHRTRADKVKNAHSLYLETLAELGPLGVALLLLALATPVYAAVEARRVRLVPGLAGAYVAFLIHMSLDWDWQTTAVALAGLLCGAAILVASRMDDGVREMSPSIRRALLAGTVTVVVVAFVGLVSNMSLSQAATNARKGNWNAAAHEASRAHTWAPWSSEPYRLLGESQLGQGDTKAAVGSFDKGIAKSPDDWNLWFDLARATTGRLQQQAIAHARRLNPLSPEIAELRRELAQEKVIDVTGK